MILIPVKCPSCHEAGKVPEHFAGAKIKCKKCGAAFVVPNQETAKPAAARSAVPVDGIAVDGLDESSWTTTSEPIAAQVETALAVVAEVPSDAHPDAREYKLLTPKDKCFENRFDLEKLEIELNRRAKQGWVVKGMVTPHIEGFSGGPREMLVVLLER